MYPVLLARVVGVSEELQLWSKETLEAPQVLDAAPTVGQPKCRHGDEGYCSS
jgi:hypothetical protein